VSSAVTAEQGVARLPRFSNSAKAAGLELPGLPWLLPLEDGRWLAFAFSPHERHVECLRLLATGALAKEALESARDLGGPQAVRDLLISALAAQGGDRVGV
jgi:hypothetical protein